MDLILPNYLLKWRIFECKHCGYKFKKQTPSQVEKCPKCSMAVFDVLYKQGDPLDTYSQAKLRWYSDPSGQRHLDEIQHRQIKEVDGKQVVAITDDKKRVIDYMPSFSVKDTKIGTKNSVKDL